MWPSPASLWSGDSCAHLHRRGTGPSLCKRPGAKANEGKGGPVSTVLGARAELVLGREGSHPPWQELGINTGIATGFAPGKRGSGPLTASASLCPAVKWEEGYPPACSDICLRDLREGLGQWVATGPLGLG